MLGEIAQAVIVLGLFSLCARGNRTFIATPQIIIYQMISYGGKGLFQLVHTINCMGN